MEASFQRIECDTNDKAISPISGRISRPLFQHQVLGKHLSSYYFDEEAGYIFAANPHWLTEAYSSAITITDTGILERNIRNIKLCKKIITNLGITSSDFRGVDLGAGYGLLVRGLRDEGLSFYWHDLYADNLMARGFEANPGSYDVAVAFEVLEHTINPLEFLMEHKKQFEFSRLIFSATCFDENKFPDKDWWYWAFETGQHISFFSQKTLEYLAKNLQMRLSHIEADIYMFEDLALPDSTISIQRSRLQRVIDYFRKDSEKNISKEYPSLTWSDHLMLRDVLRNTGNSDRQ